MTSNSSILLSIVIVNFRTPQFVIDCLETLLPELSGLAAKVVVVDNKSGDDSADIIQEWLATRDTEQRVTLVRSASNSGFAGGNNTGINAIPAKLYLLLNSDTLVRPGSIRKLLDAAAKYPEAGLLSPRLEWPDGRGQESCFRFHTPSRELMAAAQTGFIDKWLKSHVVAMPVQDKIARPQWTSFACVLIRAEVFEKVGLLDEGYFMYFEDVEFCHRAGRAGWGIVHDPEARVVHLRGGTSPVKENTRLKKRLPRYFYESRARFYYQLYGWPGLTAANLLWWAGRAVSLVRQILGRPDKTAIDKQWLDIWINWLNPLKSFSPPKS